MESPRYTIFSPYAEMYATDKNSILVYFMQCNLKQCFYVILSSTEIGASGSNIHKSTLNYYFFLLDDNLI